MHSHAGSGRKASMTDAPHGPRPGRLAQAAKERVFELHARPALASLWEAVRASKDELANLAAELCEVPAPTFQEMKRGRLFGERLSGFCDEPVEQDGIGNRWVSLKGTGAGPRVLVAAHLDTVFPEGTDCRVKRKGDRWYGPGLGDNCAGQAVLALAGRLLNEAGRPFRGELVLAGNVGEEGLGDLRGMRALCKHFAGRLDGALALDGALGSVACAGVGSRRYRICVKGPGGHSWSDFGRPSAVHQLARIASSLTELHASAQPPSTFNVGVLRGGTTVNSIAEEAELLLDLRSVDQQALDDLDAQAMRRVRRLSDVEGLTIEVERVGERPAGDARLTQDWVDMARAAWLALDVKPHFVTMSSDANIPLAQGTPASAMGVRRGGAAHTKEEWIEPGSLVVGLEAFLLTALAAQELLLQGS